MYNFKSDIKEELAKRYTLRYTVSKWKNALAEYLWVVTAIAAGFLVTKVIGWHIMARRRK